MKGQQPEQQLAAPIDTSPIAQTNDNIAQIYDNILTMPTLPDLQHAQITPPQNPSLVVNPPLITRRTRRHTTSSSHTHTLSDEPLSARTRSCLHLSSFSAVKSPLIMPQVTSPPLPILEGGEELQEENKDKHHEELTINILNDKVSWTIVSHKKKKKQQSKTNISYKWNQQQKINFEQYSDIS
jgi:hypothetical protein